MGRSASSSASALIQQPAASMLDDWLFIFDIDDKRQAIYKTTTMTDKTLANPSEGRTGDRTRGTSDDLVDSLGAEKGQRAR
jgi:hypothetical protein